MASLTALKTRMTEIVTPVVTEAGYDLEGLTVNRVGRRLLVRVTVDGDHGVDLDSVAELSRRISDKLDAADRQLGSEPYTLEVSSPGVDRPLTQIRHWRRAVGRLVETTRGTGRIIAVTDDVVSLEIAGKLHEATPAELGPGKVQVEFHRPDEDFLDIEGEEAAEIVEEVEDDEWTAAEDLGEAVPDAQQPADEKRDQK